MKRLSLYLFLIFFTLQTSSLADDIRDFQIEGISIGDSLLDYFSEEVIKDRSYSGYKSKKFLRYVAKEDNELFKIYDTVDFHYKKNDAKYIIHSMGGVIWYENNIKECKKKMHQIVEEMSEILKDSVKDDQGTEPWLEIDKTGKTKTANVYFFMKNGNYVEIACYDWSDKITKEKNYHDHLKVALITNEFGEWLRKEAH